MTTTKSKIALVSDTVSEEDRQAANISAKPSEVPLAPAQATVDSQFVRVTIPQMPFVSLSLAIRLPWLAIVHSSKRIIRASFHESSRFSHRPFPVHIERQTL